MHVRMQSHANLRSHNKKNTFTFTERTQSQPQQRVFRLCRQQLGTHGRAGAVNTQRGSLSIPGNSVAPPGVRSKKVQPRARPSPRRPPSPTRKSTKWWRESQSRDFLCAFGHGLGRNAGAQSGFGIKYRTAASQRDRARSNGDPIFGVRRDSSCARTGQSWRPFCTSLRRQHSGARDVKTPIK